MWRKKLPDVDIVGLLELKLKYHHKGDIKVIYSMRIPSIIFQCQRFQEKKILIRII